VENDEPARNRVRFSQAAISASLGYVLGVVVIAGQAQGHPARHGRVPLHEQLVGIDIAFLGAGHEVGVAHCGLGYLCCLHCMTPSPWQVAKAPSHTPVTLRHAGQDHPEGVIRKNTARVSRGRCLTPVGPGRCALCVPRSLSRALTSRVAIPTVRP
jgi:hypothetical protein